MKDRNAKSYIRSLVGKNLKRIRSLQNISQMELSGRAGLSTNFINEIEQQKKGISFDTLSKLSLALNVEPYEFFLPEEITNDITQLYITSIRNNVQRAVNEATDPYLKKKGK